MNNEGILEQIMRLRLKVVQDVLIRRSLSTADARS